MVVIGLTEINTSQVIESYRISRLGSVAGSRVESSRVGGIPTVLDAINKLDSDIE
jgi:hypothetical protein